MPQSVPAPSSAAVRKRDVDSRRDWPPHCGPALLPSRSLLPENASEVLPSPSLTLLPPPEPTAASPAVDECSDMEAAMEQPPASLTLLLPSATAQPPPMHPPSAAASILSPPSHANPNPTTPMQTLTPQIIPSPLAAVTHPSPTFNPPDFIPTNPTMPLPLQHTPKGLDPNNLFLVNVPIQQGSPSGKVPKRNTHHASGAYAISVKKASAHKKAQAQQRKIPTEALHDALNAGNLILSSPVKKAKTSPPAPVPPLPSAVSDSDSTGGGPPSSKAATDDASQSRLQQ